jgi:tetratricopeptide (TPR) repeat protein
LALIAAVLVSYSSVIHNGFLDYDDELYITDNPHVKAGMTWATVEWAFTSCEDYWFPLTRLSHALDYELFGLNPAGHHSANVVLHATNAVLLFLLLQSATGFRWRSLTVAALFALHPINVESVAWAAERKSVLSMLFFLLALHAYEWYARGPGLRRYAAVCVLFVLSLAAKPQAITFPFLLLLWDYWPLGRMGAPVGKAHGRNAPKLSNARLVSEKAPFLLLSAASAVVTLVAGANGTVKDLTRYSLLSRSETAVISYVRYLGKTLWPANLVMPYPHRLNLYPVWQVVAAVGLLLFISVLVLRAREQRYLVVGWLWFLGSLLPMIGLVQVGEQAMADRFAYISFLGLFLMIVWLVADWAQARQISARWLAIPAVSCLLALGILTYRQVGCWHDPESFWRRALALTQDNYLAHGGLARFLNNQGRTEEAIEQFRAVLAIRPDDLRANLTLGDYELRHGNMPVAIERYQAAVLREEDVGFRAKEYGNLGLAYYKMGQAMKAKQCYEQSLQLVPKQPALMIRLGLIAQNNGDLAEAVRQYSRASELQQSDVYNLLLAQALRQEGRVDEANAIFERTARFSPNLAEAQKTADSLLAWK